MRTFALTIFLFATLALHAQTERAVKNFHGVKGFNFYGLMQPAYHNANKLNDMLDAAGAPEIYRVTIANGGGMEYLFTSGTGIRLEIAGDNISRRRNNAVTRFRPTMVDLGLRQMLRPQQKLRPYLAAAFGARELELQVIKDVAPGSSFTSALGTANTSTLFSTTAYLTGAVGLNFQNAVGQNRSVADFSELELGYRYGLSEPEWRTEFRDAPSIADEVFRQFYVSLKLGFQAHSQLRKR